MSDHDFEKQVQLKMEQFRLRPSNAVWTEVEKNIRRDKRRRRMIIWVPLLLLFVGAGGYFALKETSRSAEQGLVKQSTPSSPASSTQNDRLSPNSSTQTPDHTAPANLSRNNEPASSGNQASEPTTGETSPAAPVAGHDQPSVTARTADPMVTDKAVTTTLLKTPVRKNKPRPVINDQAREDKFVKRPEQQVKKNHQPVHDVPAITDPQLADAQQKQMAEQQDSTGLAANDKADQQVMDSTAATVSSATIDSSMIAVTVTDSAASTNALTATVAADSAANNKGVAAAPLPDSLAVAKVQPEKKKQASKWQWGIQAEAGYSGITDKGLFSLEQEAPMADLATPVSGPSVNFAPQFPRPVTKPASITMGPAFSIGGFVQRSLSNRLSLSAGLQYTYLSARTVVGNKVNNNRTVNRAPATSQVVSSYYDANHSQEYTNKYHFIELPVTLHTQLNKGKRLPLVWDAGFSVSKLLSTTALHYDGLGAVYYEDNSLFNKMQWVVSTGFNFGLFPQSKHPVMIGPMMRYNISGLLKKDYSIGQHLWSAGIRASILMKK